MFVILSVLLIINSFHIHLAICNCGEWDGNFIIQTLFSRETQDVIAFAEMFTTHAGFATNRLQICLKPTGTIHYIFYPQFPLDFIRR
jgi:hypothetical protein